MSKIKIGDRVKRISTLGDSVSHCGMKVGDVATVSGTDGWDTLYLEDFHGAHARECFELLPPEYPNPPHKHAELIKAWADGAEIELRGVSHGRWFSCPTPDWSGKHYRIKPSSLNADKIAEIETTISKLQQQVKELKHAD